MHNSAFHAGELAVQQMAGEQYFASQNSALIRDNVEGGVADFIYNQSFLVATSLDTNRKGLGGVWRLKIAQTYQETSQSA